ncbi:MULTISPECIES: Rmf/CrpP family protein [Pandoraea]|nr:MULTISPECIES: Rmf/CrpP family protein [Pandoraea]
MTHGIESGEYWDAIEGEAVLAVEQGMDASACPYVAGSDEANYWLFTFENFRARPYVEGGGRAARAGQPITACPSGLESSLREAWEQGWRVTNDGEFRRLKDLEIEFRVTGAIRK